MSIKSQAVLKEGVNMSFAFEFFTDIMLDAAMLIMVLSLARRGAHGSRFERLTAFCMGIGFLLYCAAKAVSGASCTLFVLAVLGFMLSYTAFLFAFSRE